MVAPCTCEHDMKTCLIHSASEPVYPVSPPAPERCFECGVPATYRVPEDPEGDPESFWCEEHGQGRIDSRRLPPPPVRIPIDREERFVVTVSEYGSVHMTKESLCLCVRFPDVSTYKNENGSCGFCDGDPERLWSSSQDEGTSLPLEQVPDLIAILQKLVQP